MVTVKISIYFACFSKRHTHIHWHAPNKQPSKYSYTEYTKRIINTFEIDAFAGELKRNSFNHHTLTHSEWPEM